MARDTGEDWQKIAREEPWYGVLSAPEFLSANLTDAIKDKFYAQGEREMNEVVGVLREHFGPFRPKIGADFGSGLGRLSFPMARICDHVHGIDVAPAMCAEASNQARERGVKNASFGSQLPEAISVDWINSYIVIQHILPRVGYGLISKLLATLNKGGFISMQITFAHDARDKNVLLRDMNSWRFDGETATVLEEASYEIGQMSMYDYDLNRIFMTFMRAGIRDFFLRHTDHGGVHGFWIFGRKTL